MLIRKFVGIFIKRNLLRFCSNIYNKRIQTKNYFYISISNEKLLHHIPAFQLSIPSPGKNDEMGCFENQNSNKSRNLPNTISMKLCENTLLYNSDYHTFVIKIALLYLCLQDVYIIKMFMSQRYFVNFKLSEF